MSDDGSSHLHIDSDWKEEARKEKERLAAEEKTRQDTQPAATGDASQPFLELVNLVATQAVVGLGGMQMPTGEKIPPNPDTAKVFIDILEMLDTKTKGNLTDDEGKILQSVLYELRMQFVNMVQGGAKPEAPEEPKSE